MVEKEIKTFKYSKTVLNRKNGGDEKIATIFLLCTKKISILSKNQKLKIKNITIPIKLLIA